MDEGMGVKSLCQTVDSGVTSDSSPTVSLQNDSVQSNNKGARKRKGKPVKIHQEEYHKDESSSEKGYQEDEQEADEKGMFIGRVCKRRLLIRVPARPKAREKTEVDDTGGTDEDSLGAESRDDPGELKVKEGDDSESEPPTVVHALRSGSKLAPGRKRSAPSGSSRTEYRKTWCKSRPYHHCPSCDYKTRDKDTFKSHLAKHDPNAERFTCETCSKRFRNKRSFQWHLRVHRTPEQLHRCGLCSYRTPQRSIWLRHMNEVHKVDSEGNHLNDDIKCGECSFTCVTEYRLKLHVKAKHCEKQHKCPECPYSAISKCDVEKHVVIRHRNERRHLCSECGYMAKTVSALNDHARGHRGLKSFVCDTCGKAYARGDKLKIHLRTHSDDQKPYICPYCMHACSRKDHLQVHLKRVHKKVLENENYQQQAASTKAPIEPTSGNC